MNKTLTVNIAGLVFHIDENAYQSLHQYLEAIKRSITNEERDEIIHDIELRIAELFSERINDFNQVIVQENVDEIITIMGKPEDYNLGQDEQQTQQDQSYYQLPKVKKLYRDKDKALLGGVLAGFGHYFKIDVVWLRLIFLILFLVYGTGGILYLILWIVIPKAKTTSEILEMRGEPINISSIEKKVKENIDYVTSKVQNIDYSKISKNTRETTNQGLEIIKRLLGVVLIIIAVIGFLSSSMASVFIFKNGTYINSTVTELFFNSAYPTWLSISLFFFIVLAPFLVFLLVGLKLLYSNIKYILAFSLSIFILWIISIFAFALPAADLGKLQHLRIEHKQENFKQEDFKFEREITLTKALDTLNLKLMNYSFFTPGNIASDSLDVSLLSNLDLDIEFKETTQDVAYAVLNVKVDGKDLARSKDQSPTQIPSYDIEYRDNTLYLSNRIVYDASYTNLKSDVKVTIYLPNRSTVAFDQTLTALIKDQDHLIPGAHTYQIIDKQLFCVDCN